jgi:hypothetical protein
MAVEGSYASAVALLMCFQDGLEALKKSAGPFVHEDIIEAFGGKPLGELVKLIGSVPALERVSASVRRSEAGKRRRRLVECASLDLIRTGAAKREQAMLIPAPTDTF